MYARNYSAEENLDALFQHGGNLSSDIPTVPCQAGWKFQYNDQESTTVVAEVSFVFCQIYAWQTLFCFVSPLSFSPSRLAWFLIHQMCYLPRQETSLPITVNHCRSLNKLSSSSSSSKRAIIFKSMRKPRLSLYPIIPLLPFLHLFKQWPISGYTQIIFVGIYWFY